MSEQSTLQRTLEMLIILSRPGGASTSYLAEKYGCSIRTIQRTIDTIKEAGYVVDEHKKSYKIDKLATKKTGKFDIGDLLHFSKEEAELLNRSIQSIPGRNAIKENLTKKLYSLYGSENVANNLVRQEDSEQVRIIIEAIQNKFKIEVVEYTWTTTNRGLQSVVIEPIEFASDYSRIWAFYPEQKKNFLLRLSGINGVTALYEPYEYEQYHKMGYVDVFRGYGYSKTRVKLTLNRRAYGFLCEEFPLAKADIKNIYWQPYYHLDTEVCDYFQLARFYLGLPGDIEIEEAEGFLDYVKEMPDPTLYDYDEYMGMAVSRASGDKFDQLKS